jgi:glycosyltransferase involved in cell wall biosynthesis
MASREHASLIRFAPARERDRPVVLMAGCGHTGGMARHMIALGGAVRAEVEPLLAFPDNADGQEALRAAQQAGLRACLVPGHGGHALWPLLEQYRPDLVHVHAGGPADGHPLALLARQCGVRGVIRTEHLPWTHGAGLREHDYARGVKAVDRVICVSRAARQTYLSTGAEPERYEVVYNGAELPASLPARQAARAALGLEGSFAVLTAGPLVREQRHDVLLAALPVLLRRYPQLRLLVAGAGPEEAVLHAQAERLGVAGHLRFLGGHASLPELMAACDVFCLPSCLDGHPLVLLDAMAAGLPVAAARALGITEAVQHEETGLLFPCDSPLLLANALGRLIGDPILARCLGEAGRQAAGRVFSAARMGRETLAVYRRVLGRRPLPASGRAAPVLAGPFPRPPRPLRP